MNFPFVILFCVIWSTPPLNAQTSSPNNDLLLLNLTRKSHHREMHYQKQHEHHQQQINHNISLDNQSNGIADPRPWRRRHVLHHHRHLRIVHGTVNIVGWGVLLPIGVIIARYCRKLLDEWYTLYILTQLSGFVLGTVGWGLGISIKNSSKEHNMSTHGILGTIIFAFGTLQPGEGNVRRKYWVIYHHVLGYALIVLIIANIFEGINNQSAAKGWEWAYGAILGVLGVSAIALEVFRSNLN